MNDGLGVGVEVGLGVGLGVWVGLGVGVGVVEGVGVGVGVGVAVGVAVGVRVGTAAVGSCDKATGGLVNGTISPWFTFKMSSSDWLELTPPSCASEIGPCENKVALDVKSRDWISAKAPEGWARDATGNARPGMPDSGTT